MEAEEWWKQGRSAGDHSPRSRCELDTGGRRAQAQKNMLDHVLECWWLDHADFMCLYCHNDLSWLVGNHFQALYAYLTASVKFHSNFWCYVYSNQFILVSVQVYWPEKAFTGDFSYSNELLSRMHRCTNFTWTWLLMVWYLQHDEQ